LFSKKRRLKSESVKFGGKCYKKKERKKEKQHAVSASPTQTEKN